jgi:hypothetical protein
MVGFILGALLVWGIRRPSRPAPEAARAPAPTTAAAPIRAEASSEETPFSTVQNVFAVWGRYAVWQDDATQIAVYNTRTRDYRDCFEVIRIQDECYFRSIPRLTHPVLTHGGVPEECPIQFTETEEQRERWLRENNKAGAEDAMDALGASLGNRPQQPKR